MILKDFGKLLLNKNTAYLLVAILILMSFNQLTSAQGSRNNNRLKFSSHYTDFKTACFADEGQSGTDDCPAYKGYKLYVFWGGCTSSLVIKKLNNGEDEYTVTSEGFDYLFDTQRQRGKVEWRLANGQPFALIYRRDVTVEVNDFCQRKKTGEELRVIGLFDETINFTVNANTKNANVKARQLADNTYKKR